MGRPVNVAELRYKLHQASMRAGLDQSVHSVVTLSDVLAAMPALLDEVERLRAEVAARQGMEDLAARWGKDRRASAEFAHGEWVVRLFNTDGMLCLAAHGDTLSVAAASARGMLDADAVAS